MTNANNADRAAVCVFCGAAEGSKPSFVDAARELAEILTSEGLGLVYGAGGVGVMGALSQGMLDAGGRVVGVIPRGLVEREMARPDLDDLRIVGSMHERKKLMHDLSDVFVVLPGGLGTLEEFFEVLTWAQLGLHAKPIAVIDVAGFYAPLRTLLAHCVTTGFVTQRDHSLVSFLDSMEDVRSWLRERLRG
jgi:uncharacterized protein (TIGR00730 family)